MGRGSSSDIRGRRSPRSTLRTSFAEFVTGVIQKSQVALPVILVALVYIERSRSHLFIELEQWACERIFLGALVVASKVSLDFTVEGGFFLLICRSITRLVCKRYIAEEYLLGSVDRNVWQARCRPR